MQKSLKFLGKRFLMRFFSILDEKYKFEPRGNFQNTAIYIAKPINTLQVSKIMINANAIGFGVVPYSGGSGLVCGQISLKGQPLLLSLERLNKIREFNPVSGVVKVEAGVVLSDLKKVSKAHNRQFPLSLASQEVV